MVLGTSNSVGLWNTGNNTLSAKPTASYQCVWRFFPSMSLKYCACPEKVMPGHTKCCTLFLTRCAIKVHNPLCLPREATSERPKVVRTCGAFNMLTWKRASRHSGMHFFISYLARWLRTRRFSEPTFGPSGAKNHWKDMVFHRFATFSRTCIFFSLTLSLLWSSLFFSSLLFLFSALLFSSLTLPTSASPSVHIVGSLTSKHPSISMIRTETIPIFSPQL